MSLQPSSNYSSIDRSELIADDSSMQDNSLTLLIQKALKDRLLLQEICDRVYQLMLQDLQQQKKRSCRYQGW